VSDKLPTSRESLIVMADNWKWVSTRFDKTNRISAYWTVCSNNVTTKSLQQVSTTSRQLVSIFDDVYYDILETSMLAVTFLVMKFKPVMPLTRFSESHNVIPTDGYNGVSALNEVLYCSIWDWPWSELNYIAISVYLMRSSLAMTIYE